MRRYFISTVLVLNIVIALSAIIAQTSEQPKWITTPVKELVDQARAATKQVTVEDLKKALDAKEAGLLLLDVREPKEYEAAHIPGAVNAPRGLLEFEIWSVAPDRNKKIFVYCKTGVRAALATKLLNELGYKNAVSVDTGAIAWMQAGYPLQTDIADEEVVIVPIKKEAGASTNLQ